MTETLPDRLSTDPSSPHHNPDLLRRGVGIRFNGVEKTNVEEYCLSEGWVRVAAGKAVDRRGRPLTLLLRGGPVGRTRSGRGVAHDAHALRTEGSLPACLNAWHAADVARETATVLARRTLRPPWCKLRDRRRAACAS